MPGTLETVKTGISALDAVLKEGMPRSSFVVISGEGGTGKSVLLSELFYRRLEAGEPCIYICLDDLPNTVIQQMLRFGWSLQKYLDAGKARFIDCFSFRIKPEKVSTWVTLVNEPSDLMSFLITLETTMDELGMRNRGVVIIDSLTEFMTLAEPGLLIEAIKTWRARGPKERGVIFFGSMHFGIATLGRATDVLDYIVDGIIDLRYDPFFVQQGQLVRQLRVRKMKGVSHSTEWVPFGVGEAGIQILPQARVRQLRGKDAKKFLEDVLEKMREKEGPDAKR
ncbi:MAG: RAD55 family ATPase [Candidatus Hodarchaeaceae archaeon]|nr:RAD55 family ATPase [Candidatus Hodarchaeaceae archaeon]